MEKTEYLQNTVIQVQRYYKIKIKYVKTLDWHLNLCVALYNKEQCTSKTKG